MRWAATTAGVAVLAMLAAACGTTTSYPSGTATTTTPVAASTTTTTTPTPTTGTTTKVAEQPTDPEQWVAAAAEGIFRDPERPATLGRYRRRRIGA